MGDRLAWAPGDRQAAEQDRLVGGRPVEEAAGEGRVAGLDRPAVVGRQAAVEGRPLVEGRAAGQVEPEAQRDRQGGHSGLELWGVREGREGGGERNMKGESSIYEVHVCTCIHLYT